jgi:hypothetical protein
MGVTRRRLLRDGLGAGLALSAAGGLPRALLDPALAAGGKAGYATGFSSLTDEFRLPDVPVEGRVPRWLEGALLRNGPALFEIGEQKLNHWFDGLAMIHAFYFESGRVAYANRFLRSSAYRAWRRDGVMKYSEFGTDPDPDPCRAYFRDVSTLPVLGKIPNANVSIEQLANRFQAHTELPVPVRFNGKSLRTLGPVGEMPQGRMGTAHPHHDPRTGERFSYEIELIPPSGIKVYSERNGSRRELAFIQQERPATCTRSRSPGASSRSSPSPGSSTWAGSSAPTAARSRVRSSGTARSHHGCISSTVSAAASPPRSSSSRRSSSTTSTASTTASG